MRADPTPEHVLDALNKGRLAPFYLFYGPGEFRLEKVLDKIRKDFVSESARDLNTEVFYGDGKTNPSDICDRARTMPFLDRNRLIIVRRTEGFSAGQLDTLLPYLEAPSESTCLIFISAKPDFRKTFYNRIRNAGRAVQFAQLKDREVAPWIRRFAKDLGLRIDPPACHYLHQIAGNRLRDLYVELEKLYLRYGRGSVGIEEVKESAIHSRVYSIFELVNAVSEKKADKALRILGRYLEEEDSKAPLRFIGMLNRQLKLLLKTRAIADRGGGVKEVSRILGAARFSAGDFISQSRNWTMEDIERGFCLLYGADNLLKSNSPPSLVLENMVLSMCG